MRRSKATSIFIALLVVTSLLLGACQPQVVVEENVVIQGICKK